MNKKMFLWLLVAMVVVAALLFVDFELIFGGEEESEIGNIQVELDESILRGDENIVISEEEVPEFIVE